MSVVKLFGPIDRREFRRVEGDPVDDRGDEAGVGEDGAPFIRGWHMLILEDPGWCLGFPFAGVSADL
jgi:hypothetical protein